MTSLSLMEYKYLCAIGASYRSLAKVHVVLAESDERSEKDESNEIVTAAATAAAATRGGNVRFIERGENRVPLKRAPRRDSFSLLRK